MKKLVQLIIAVMAMMSSLLISTMAFAYTGQAQWTSGVPYNFEAYSDSYAPTSSILTVPLLNLVAPVDAASPQGGLAPYFFVHSSIVPPSSTSRSITPHGGGGCGRNGYPNTGWHWYTSNWDYAQLGLCSYDAGGHTMVTDWQFYSNDGPISYFETAAHYSDGYYTPGYWYYPAPNTSVSGQWEHTFSSGGWKTIDYSAYFKMTNGDYGGVNETQGMTIR